MVKNKVDALVVGQDRLDCFVLMSSSYMDWIAMTDKNTH